jgi:hypothetical protein
MREKFLRAGIGAALCLCLFLAAPSLWAQADEFAIAPASPTSTATQGIFGTEVNDYLDPVNWSGVEYEKFFSFLGHDGTVISPNLGFVTKLGALTLGAYYTGTAVGFGKAQTSSVNVVYDGTTGEETSRATFTGNTNPFVYTDNTLGILIGVGSLGINVGLTEKLQGSTTFVDDFFNPNLIFGGDTTYQEYVQKFADGSERGHSVEDFSWTAGSLTPVISVGTSLSLGGWALKPRLDLGFGFNFGGDGDTAPTNAAGVNSFGTGSFVYEEYRSASGVDFARNKVEYTANHLVLNPKFVIGADLDFAPGTGPSLAVQGGFNLHPGDFGATNKATALTSPTQTTITETKTDTYSEWSQSKFVIQPAYRYALPLGDRVELGLKGGLDFAIRNTHQKPDNSTTTTARFEYPNPAGNYTQTQTEYNVPPAGSTLNEQEVSEWVITPTAAVGIQFAAIPSRLTLNAGVNLSLPGFTSTETKNTPLQSKTVIKTEGPNGFRSEYVSDTGGPAGASTSSINNAWTAFGWSFGAGFGFIFNETFGADVVFASNPGAAMNFTVTDLAVLFTVRR